MIRKRLLCTHTNRNTEMLLSNLLLHEFSIKIHRKYGKNEKNWSAEVKVSNVSVTNEIKNFTIRIILNNLHYIKKNDGSTDRPYPSINKYL